MRTSPPQRPTLFAIDIFRLRCVGQPIRSPVQRSLAIATEIEDARKVGKYLRRIACNDSTQFFQRLAGLLAEFNREFQMAVSYVDTIKNQAMVSPADYPSMPESKSFKLSSDKPESSKPRFEPLQRGIKL